MGILEFHNVSKGYGDTPVLRNLSFDVQEGQFLAILGFSGSGKTTLINLMAGLTLPDRGEVRFQGAPVTGPGPERGLVFQSYALYPHMTVYDNMAFGMKLAKASPEAMKQRVMEAAKLLQIDHLLDRLPKQLSGGQRQRVAIGRAIVRDPRVFLFDEPLSNLDAALRVQTRLEIAKLHHSMADVTMIYVTHDQVEAMTLADRIAVLRDGKLEQVGTPAELYDNPNSIFVAGFIGSPKMNFLTGKFAADHGCTTLGIRSEHIDVVEGAGLWNGEVVHAEDLGSDNYLFVEVGSDEPLIVRQEGKLKIALGAKVGLTPKAGQVHRFDANGKPIR